MNRFRRSVLVIGALAVIVVGIALATSGSGERPEEPGRQLTSPNSRVRGPGTRDWVALTADDGVERAGWPLPMIARGPLTCFGFGRVDFEQPRPTLARCVESIDVPELPANGIVSLVVVQTGRDYWHLLQVGGEVGGVDLVSTGAALDGGRVHTDGDLIALRLPASSPLAEVSWIIGRNRVVCTPAPDAALTAEFCT